MGKYGQYGALVAALGCAVAGEPAAACRLALVLAIDVSSSVDAEEDRLQRSGLAAALLAPDVVAAFLGSPDPVALAVFEWSGREDQVVLLPWTLISDHAKLGAAAEAVGRSTRSRSDMPTAVGYALGYAAVMLRQVPQCLFHTIDVAGDGINNEGFGPDEAYRAFEFDEVVVNGLMVDTGAVGDSTDLIDFYQNSVRRGPASFVEVAQGFGDYERAMRRKLLRELQSQMIGAAERTGEAGPG